MTSALPFEIWVKGEISNFRAPVSGHLYFTLKDDAATLRCVMFRSRAATLRFTPGDGLAVLALGRVGIYEPSGQYQLYVEALEPVGRGSLQLAFEQLKTKLEQEGLFRPEHKIPLPAWPRTVGVVTSATGAAIADITRVLAKRWPLVRVVLAPTSVQGSEAPASVATALRNLDDSGLADVIIVGRGGGSLEELSAFNDERVARAIHACRTPVVSAVGHEIDFTIADFVADARAATPSAAAAMVVPDQAEVKRLIATMQSDLLHCVRSHIEQTRSGLRQLESRLWAHEPRAGVARARQHIDELFDRATRAVKLRTSTLGRELELLCGRLDAASPLAIMRRGYSIVSLVKTGRVVRSSADVRAGDELLIRLADGVIDAVATSEVKKRE